MKIRLLDGSHGMGGDDSVKYPVEVCAEPHRVAGCYYISEDEMERVGFDIGDFRADLAAIEAENAEDGLVIQDNPEDPDYPCWVFGPESIEVIS